MTSTEPSKLSGNYHSAIGSMKQKIGSATSDPEMEAKGAMEHIKGSYEVSAAQAMNDAKKAATWGQGK